MQRMEKLKQNQYCKKIVTCLLCVYLFVKYFFITIIKETVHLKIIKYKNFI